MLTRVLRIGCLFEIIKSYPDSRPALTDIRNCLHQTPLLPELKSALSKAYVFAHEKTLNLLILTRIFRIRTRVVMTGATTSDILDCYMLFIKSLRLIDSTGALMKEVTEPIKQYLRTRENAIKEVVKYILDDKEHQLEDDDDMAENEDEDTEWTPTPIDVDPSRACFEQFWRHVCFTSLTFLLELEGSKADVFMMMITIYESKDVFVKEFQTLLAERLLQYEESYNDDKEVRNSGRSKFFLPFPTLHTL